MKNIEVDDFLNNAKLWRDEMSLLRDITLECQLGEELKWRSPCYSFEGKNIAIIGAFKDYCALSFFKGSLLRDEADILHSPGPNSQASRLFKFTDTTSILESKETIKAYIFEAIEVEKAGLKVDFKDSSEYEMPEELEQRMKEMPALEVAFQALTPGRQKGYLLHFTGAKQIETRYSRIDKYIPRILDGKGIHDCVCGLSKKFPRCDGSHQQLDKT